MYKLLDVPVAFMGNGTLGGFGVMLALLQVLWSLGYQIDTVVFIEPGDVDGNGGGERGWWHLIG
jgi:hypothetical protein